MLVKSLIRSQLRSPAGPLLLSLQVALALMLLANVAFVIYVRFETNGRPTGIDLENIFWVSSRGYSADYNQQTTVTADLNYLNALPGVVAACSSNAVPQTFQSLRSQVSPEADLKVGKRVAILYQMTEQCVTALGLRLQRGRTFARASVTPAASHAGSSGKLFGGEVVITEALAIKLFGSGEKALGQPLYFSMQSGGATVVGIVGLLQAAPYFGPDGDLVNEVVLAPAVAHGPQAHYIVRTQPGQRDAVKKRVEQELERLQPGRTIDKVISLADTAATARGADRNEAVILAILGSLVLGVTMLGLFGFGSFAVTSRIKEIGTRRALGATRGDIVRQFLLENWLITTLGLVIGCLLTLAFAVQLSLLLQMPRLPALYMIAGVWLIWIAGLLAALVPSLRAARVTPAIATRSA